LLTPVRALQFFQLLRFGAFFLTGILFAKLGLSTYDIGIYESLLFLGSVLSFFWLSGLSQSLLANYKKADNLPYERDRSSRSFEKSKEFFNAFLVLLGFSVLVFIGFRLLVTPYSFLANNPEVLAFYGPFSFYLLFIGPSFLIEYMLLLKERSKALIAYGTVAFSVQLIAVAAPIFMGYGLEEALQGLVFSSIFRFAILIVLLLKYAEFKLDKLFLSQYISTAVPLMAATLLSGSAEYLDGFIVSNYFDEGTFAVYRYGAKEFPLVLLLANAFSNGMVKGISVGTAFGKRFQQWHGAQSGAARITESHKGHQKGKQTSDAPFLSHFHRIHVGKPLALSTAFQCRFCGERSHFQCLSTVGCKPFGVSANVAYRLKKNQYYHVCGRPGTNRQLRIEPSIYTKVRVGRNCICNGYRKYFG